MPFNVNNPETDPLTRRFAATAGVGITEAIERRHREETPQETAARLRERYGVTLGEADRVPLSRDVYDAMWESR